MTPQEKVAKIAAYEASYLAEYRNDVKGLMERLIIALKWLQEAEQQYARGETITSKFARKYNYKVQNV